MPDQVENGVEPATGQRPQDELQGEPHDELLAEGWFVGPDGRRTRHAARVLLLDADGRALLVRGHDGDDPDRHWWFTVGGGIDAGETIVDAALREVREETGIVLDPAALEGPVLTRSAVFDFVREHCVQHEQLFLARVDAGTVLTQDGWTDLERSFIDELAWMTAAELRATTDEVFPACLPELVEELAPGWDGVVRQIGLEEDRPA